MRSRTTCLWCSKLYLVKRSLFQNWPRQALQPFVISRVHWHVVHVWQLEGMEPLARLSDCVLGCRRWFWADLAPFLKLAELGLDPLLGEPARLRGGGGVSRLPIKAFGRPDTRRRKEER